MSPRSDIPLCIDIDGTLVMTDTLMEAGVSLLKRNPLLLFLFPVWFFNGKAYFKQQIAKRTLLNVATLPYCKPLIRFLSDQKAGGRSLILVTASDASIARRINEHLELFSEVLASDGKTNLAGRNKANALLRKFGSKKFSYAGNALADIPVWREAHDVVAVNASAGVLRRIRNFANLMVLHDRPHVLLSLLRSMRPHQWLKNLLIFVPLFTAHRLEYPLLLSALYAFFSFSLCTSGIYIINDLMDIESDRAHPRKKFRPLASGTLPLHVAILAVPLLLFASVAIASTLPPLFLGVLATYFVLTLGYSFFIKQIVLVDVILLAGLYTIRIIAGHAVTGLPHSVWLFVFAMFFFFSLALVKRFSELLLLHSQTGNTVAGRGYMPGDREHIDVLGVASGYISVLVLALYVTSDDVTLLYRVPELLLLLCPLMLYWISRIWLLAHRGKMQEDPVIFTVKDHVSYIIGLLVLAVMFLAT